MFPNLELEIYNDLLNNDKIWLQWSRFLNKTKKKQAEHQELETWTSSVPSEWDIAVTA
jgi:hypothetical protein